ncbi:IclR family transcriptional regulator [Alicyclobacillus dauci]|uniref:IclR family transcriptional regulator n=1 Tax=Alicyclobacillus dauci TaxID=1475485 RepID=A0ABY6Z3D9_9BACL|nr:IclR family transcriptional regulator [Alicyclobacillus dauci]WAH37138.1 IclR family transcriptional regulator [Alicyclobacillus dauci]
MLTEAEKMLICGKSSAIHQDIELLDRVLAILDCLEGSQMLSLTEIAHRTNLPKPTCFRLLQAMQRNYLVRQEGRYYGLGSRMYSYVFSSIMHQPLRRTVKPFLQKLSRETHLSSLLFVRHGAFRVAIAMEEWDHGGEEYVDIGQVGVIYAGSPSKVLMAWLSKPQRDAVLAEVTWVPLTTNTLASRNEYEEECLRIRKTGWAISRGEREPTAFSISTPVRDQTGVVIAALTLTGLLSELNDSCVPIWVKSLLESSRALSSRLGYVDRT